MRIFKDFLGMLSEDVANQVSEFYGVPQEYDGGNPYSNINPTSYFGRDPKSYPGDQLYSDLIRAQTRDYMMRFAPVEDQLAQSITPTGTTYINQDLENTRQAFGGAAQSIAGQMGRQSERLGLSPQQDNGFQNQSVSAMVGGINDTYTRDQDRRSALLTGGLGALSQNVRQVRT